MTTARPTLLVVEDEEDSRESLREVLELDGYRVVTAIHGLDALGKLDELADDRGCIMLLDLHMPVMDGLQLLDQLQQRGRLGDLRLLVTTSLPQAAPPGVPVLTKPIDLDKLLQAIEQLC